MRTILVLCCLSVWCLAVAPAVASPEDDSLADRAQSNAAADRATLAAPAKLTAHLEPHTREKRTLFLKKKLIGAGLLGFGLGLAKGYKAGYHSGPDVHHVYVGAEPPSAAIKYVEYVSEPVYVSRIVHKSVYPYQW